MMLISIILLKFLGKEMKYEAEICELEEQREVIYDAGFHHCITICINRKNGRIW